MTEKIIDTLVEDIYNLFLSEDTTISEEGAQAFGLSLAHKIKERLEAKTRDPYLRFSNVGSDCGRKLHYSINSPEKGEALPPEVRIKFLFGDILEELLLFLAREAGHRVEGEQGTMSFEGLKGSRDAVIDGTLVDVKSASTYSFKKFANQELESNDPFGYVPQLSLYLEASQGDPLVTNKDEAMFLVIDKTLGHICLSPIRRKPDFNWKLFVHKRQMMVEDKENLPNRAFFPEPEGKSGNEALGLQCSYCSFKSECYPSLRTFLYSTGPKYLTKVVKTPLVPEVDTRKRKPNGSTTKQA